MEAGCCVGHLAESASGGLLWLLGALLRPATPAAASSPRGGRWFDLGWVSWPGWPLVGEVLSAVTLVGASGCRGGGPGLVGGADLSGGWRLLVLILLSVAARVAWGDRRRWWWRVATPVAAARSGRPRPRQQQRLLLIDLLAGGERAVWRVVETGGNPWSCLDHDGDGACLLMVSSSGGGIVAYADSSRTEEASGPPQQDAPRKKKVVVLGTGWGGTSFLKNLDCSRYEVKVISPRNYFAFTPLLPSVTCGTVEARSIVEPIRRMFEKKNKDVSYFEAECFKIDATKKAVHCRSAVGTNLDGNGDFEVDYDYLVVALGATVNTFNTPGVMEHCHFLKEVEDAQKIRKSVVDCFEKASLPNISEEEKRKTLHFVVIGGGPTGVEFAAELHDFLVEDLVKLYPAIQEFVKITIIQSGEHILNTFDQRIAAFAETKFLRDGIEVNTGFRVIKVSDDLITVKSKTSGGETLVPYGMAVWSAGIGTRPVITDFMNQVGQAKRRALATNEWLRVRECDGVYAIGDCSSISQRKIMEDISTIFKIADKDNSGTLTLKEISDILEDICIRYPQVELYMKSMHMLDIADLIGSAIGDSHKESMEVDIEEFKKALCHVDSQVKTVPATAQVAAQQGYYLADCFNKMDHCKEHPEGPLRLTGSGAEHHNFRPFRYKHLGQFAPLGGEQAAAELPGDWVSMGHSTQWLWYSVYASKQVSWRTRVLVVSDWTRRFIFGRDSSRI